MVYALRGGAVGLIVFGVAISVAVVGEPGAGPPLKAGPYKDYGQWAPMNTTPVFSAPHGNSFVVTYVNPTGLSAALQGNFPFPRGSVIVKEAFQNDNCEPGKPGAVFVMEKRESGFDPKASDWWWVRYNPDGTLWGAGKSGGRMDFCQACHSVARVNDFVFGNGTRMKVVPTIPLTRCTR